MDDVDRLVASITKFQLHTKGEFPPAESDEVKRWACHSDDVIWVVAWVEEESDSLHEIADVGILVGSSYIAHPLVGGAIHVLLGGGSRVKIL